MEGSEESVTGLGELEESLQVDDFPALEPFDISSSLRVTFRERKGLRASRLEQAHGHVQWKAMGFDVFNTVHAQ